MEDLTTSVDGLISRWFFAQFHRGRSKAAGATRVTDVHEDRGTGNPRIWRARISWRL